jgi:hypothetical protein
MAELAQHMADTATKLLGQPNLTLSAGDNWRYGRKGSLSVDIKRGRWFDHEAGMGGGVLALIRYMTGTDNRGAFNFLGLEPEPGASYSMAPQRVQRAVSDDKRDSSIQISREKRIALALRLWEAAIDPAGTLVETYLASRRLHLPDDEPKRVIRFHPACPFGGNAVHPCMVALFRDIVTGEPCGIHRTALTTDGGKIDKKMLGRAGGAAIMLSKSAEVTHGLGIAEGIETALSVLNTGWAPVWAIGSAGCIAAFPILDGLDALTVFADADEAGLEAARAVARRYSDHGRDGYVQIPPRGDFNDILMEAAIG